LDYAAAGDFVVPFQDDFYGLGVDAMLLFQDALGKGVFVVGVEDRDGGLQDDGTGVEIFVDEVDGAAGEFYAVFESLALRFESWKRRKERWVDIENAIGERGDEVGREQAHVSGEADEIDFGFVERGDDLAVEGFALEAFGGDDAGGQAAFFGAFDAGGAFAIAEDNGDFGVGDAGGVDAVGKRDKVGATTAQEDADATVHERKTVAQMDSETKKVRSEPPPGGFLRKDVSLWGLRRIDAQGCDFRGVSGLSRVGERRRRDLGSDEWGYHEA
jgi:hypothetical protein